MKLVLLSLCVGLLASAQAPQEGDHVIPSLDGQTLFVTYCAVCHGKAADGTGPIWPDRCQNRLDEDERRARSELISRWATTL